MACRGLSQRSRLGMLRGRADLRNHGTTYGRSWRWAAGYALLGHATCITAEWNGLDVHADERLPFGALAEADLQPANRCSPVLTRHSPNRTQIAHRPRSFRDRAFASGGPPGNRLTARRL